METICMKCQILFSLKSKKNITNLSSAELVQSIVKVNVINLYVTRCVSPIAINLTHSPEKDL